MINNPLIAPETVRQIFLWLVGFGSLGISYWSAYEQNALLATLSFLGALFVLFFANLSHFSEFKASATGFEAKTREIIQRAELTLAELQKLAKLTSETLLTLTQSSNRFGGGMPEEDKERLADEVRELLYKFRIPGGEVNEVFKTWNRYVEFDYQLSILCGKSKTPDGATPEQMATWRNATRDLFDNPRSPAEVRKICKDLNALTNESPRLYRRLFRLSHAAMADSPRVA